MSIVNLVICEYFCLVLLYGMVTLSFCQSQILPKIQFTYGTIIWLANEYTELYNVTENTMK